MTFYYLDASAWVKRYQNAAGTDWLNRFWQPGRQIACADLGLVEVCCTLARRHAGLNRPEADTRALLQSVRHDFGLLAHVRFDEPVLRLAEALVLRRRLRGADSVHLASALRMRELRPVPIAFVTADMELLQAAVAEGFTAIDPSIDPAVPAIDA